MITLSKIYVLLGQMIRWVVLSILFLGFVVKVLAQVSVTGSTGANNTYSTLKDAFDAINSNTQNSSNNIEVTITDNTTETATAALNSGGWNSLVIYPTQSGLSISGDLAAPLIDLNGVSNVTIDGRVNQTGTDKSLVIENENTSTTAGTSTIRFINGAQDNTIRYTILRGSAGNVYDNSTSGGTPLPQYGVLLFHTSSITGQGNSNNTIQFNDLTNAGGNRPYLLLASYGSFNSDNVNNLISENHFYDFELMRSGGALRIGSRSSAWEIIGNHFFQPNTVNYKANPNVTSFISIESGTNYKINSNVFGGQEPNAGGGRFVILHATTNSAQTTFIRLNSTTTSGNTEVKNNSFKNIDLTAHSSGSCTFISAFNRHPLLIEANEIGVQNASDNIILRNTSGHTFRGINIGISAFSASNTAPDTVRLNLIGGIEMPSNQGVTFYGISSERSFATSWRARNLFISENTIGSPSQTNSIIQSHTSPQHTMTGVFINFQSVNPAARTVTIKNNTIANLTSMSASTASVTEGIYAEDVVNLFIQDNEIMGLSSASLSTQKNPDVWTNRPAIIGISDMSQSFSSISRTESVITGNILRDFTLTGTNAPGQILGINNASQDKGGLIEIERNFIHSFTINSPGANAEITGIRIGDNRVNANTNPPVVAYNIIRLGGDNDYIVSGIRQSNHHGNIFFNTVFIDGDLSSGTAQSYALITEGGTTNATKDIRNNIFENRRSTSGGSSLHYAIFMNSYTSTANTTLDYNNYRTTGTGGVLGYYNSTDQTTPTFQSTTWNQNSLNLDPNFASAGGTVAVDYETTASLPGTPIAAVPQDYFGNNRNLTTTQIGAYEEDNCIIFGVAPTVGDGLSVGTAFEIATFANLLWIAEDATRWDKIYIQTANIDAVVTKTSEICFGTEGWSPIGTAPAGGLFFTGEYDGNGHTISNLYINRSSRFQGLFGVTLGATIKNLGLLDVDITGQDYVGALIGEAVGSSNTIQECFSQGEIFASFGPVGGLVGSVSGSIQNFYARVNVTANSAGSPSFAAGGLFGLAQANSVTITNSYAAGTIEANSGIYKYGLGSDGGGTNTFSNLFYDNDLSTNLFPSPGTPRTTTQMQQQATFTNWDFQCETTNGTDDIWGIDEGKGYPVLSVFGYTQECLGSWLGTVSSDWNTAGNWANNLVPIPNVPIHIEAAAQNDLVLDQNRVVGDITFYDAKKNIVLGDYDLTAASITDADADNYIQTNGAGSLKISIADAASFVFPVGNAAYNPVTITNKSGATDVFSAKVRDEVLVNGTSGRAVTDPHVGVTWDIDKATANSGDGIDMVFQWNASQEVGTLTDYKLNHHNGSEWEIALGTSGAVSGTPKTMTHTAYTGSFSPFAISGSDVTPLPVEWKAFTAKAQGNTVLLEWSTANEINNSHFEVLHSVDGNGWSQLTQVSGAGTSYQVQHYDYVHTTPAATNYYRIKQVDRDGHYQFSPTRWVVLQNTKNSITDLQVFPNPSQGRVTVLLPGHHTCELYDMQGKLIHKTVFSDKLELSALSSGVYTLKVQSGNQLINHKLIVTQ